MNSTGRRWFLGLTIAVVAAVAGYLAGKRGGPEVVDEPVAPLIGIASLESENCISAVIAAGGVPVVLPDTEGSEEKIPDYLEQLDGLLMPGGQDIPPSEYGEETHETVLLLDDNRYRFERALSRAWIEQSEKPFLGICLGSQWLNVSSGGTLIQDIPSETGGNHGDVEHSVILEEDSRLFSIFGESEFEVNSTHHQAVDELGEGLRIVARSPDGIIEATESTDPGRFLIGVQWHPERLVPEDERQAKLIRAFVDAAAEKE
ncbi:MAG: gamma-glutamyl-gamma-aminobutyrate hydrolase family protein [Verrucomicrobiales bacterium]|nr:gamma-glutamyl-gamma-aminobutyrate hydrolase family protein [Verrucomicrobiales bacterium]